MYTYEYTVIKFNSKSIFIFLLMKIVKFAWVISYCYLVIAECEKAKSSY